MMNHLLFITRPRQYLLQIGKNEFSKNSAIKFSTPCHLPSRHDISTKIAPNHARLGPMETRYPDLFRDTKLEEIWASEGQQLVAQK